MIYETERAVVAAYGRRLVSSGLTVGTGGNLSVRAGDGFVISPSGMAYEDITPADVPFSDLAGRAAAGERRPSSEAGLHRLFYAGRPECGAVVHTHSPAVTAFSCLRRPLPAISYLIALAGRAEIPCAPYCTFGTEELAQATYEYARGGDAVLLANHGAVCVGTDMAAAFALAQQLEFCADIYMRVLASGQTPVLLTEQEMDDARRRFGNYGQK